MIVINSIYAYIILTFFFQSIALLPNTSLSYSTKIDDPSKDRPLGVQPVPPIYTALQCSPKERLARLALLS